MTDDGRTVEDELAASARVALAVAAQLADKFARAREELARQAQHQNEQVQRQLQARFDGERNAARNRLALTQQPEWWDRAAIAQIAGMHETAKQWTDFDPQARAACETIAREVRERYGNDIANPGADPRAVRAALSEAELNRDLAARGERGGAVAEFTEAIEAVRLADQLDARAAGTQQDVARSSEVSAELVADTARTDEAARLVLQAREYDLQADQGGTFGRAPDQLRELAADARAQAQLHIVEAGSESSTVDHSATGRFNSSGRAESNGERAADAQDYDSAARREELAMQLSAHGFSQETIDVRLRADLAQGRPAIGFIEQTGGVRVPQTTRGRGVNHTSNRPERSR